jgi:hypothetical protein
LNIAVSMIFVLFLFFATPSNAQNWYADIVVLVHNPDVASYLKANPDQWLRLTNSLQECQSALVAYNYAVKSLQSATIGESIQAAQNDVQGRNERLDVCRTAWQGICDEIRRAALRNPPLNHSEPGPTLDDDLSVPNASPSVPRTALDTPPLATSHNLLTWPDGRILAHAEHSVKTSVVKVATNDTLKIRSGPGTRFSVIASMSAEATDIMAYDQDQVWDGDTWWCPIEWHGYRGYVGRSHLPGGK